MSKESEVTVKYAGPFYDFSGYGEACRNYICALDAAGVNLVTEIISYTQNTDDLFGRGYRLARGYSEKKDDYDIKVLHVPPDSYSRNLEVGKYHVGHLFWETGRISSGWVWNCNLMDEIWTGSKHNQDAFIRSGVTKPIYIFPQPIDIGLSAREYKDWVIQGHDGFLFYSIFQWIERKNPQALIKAYLREFSSTEKVGLLIKTYIQHFDDEEREKISQQISGWKKEVNNPDPPPIYLNVRLMDREDVLRIHHTGDCFVLPHRGEGWLLPAVEALVFGNTLIATDCGGIHGWLPSDVYLPISYQEIDVFGMEHAPWYETNQKWADVRVEDVMSKMRWVFDNQEKAAEVAGKAQKFVREEFSFQRVGTELKRRLVEIQRSIDVRR